MNETLLAQDPMALGTKLNGSPGSVFITDEWGNLKIIQMHSKFRDITKRGHAFAASTQAGVGGQAVTVFTATTYTGLYVYNPTTSPVTLSLLSVTTALAVAEAAISAIFLGKFTSMTEGASPYTPYPTSIGSAATSYAHAGFASAGATLAGSAVVWPIVGGALINTFPYASGPTVLDGLFEFGPISPTELAAVAGMPPTTLSHYIRHMRERGHLVEQRRPTDGRSRALSLSPAGLAAHRRANRAFEIAYAAFVAHVRDEPAVRAALESVETAARDALTDLH